MSTRPKILLVDDRRENLMALEAQLRQHDADLLCAESGRRALDLLLEHEVALALIDVQMPEMDGFELAELMRGSRRTGEIPIIFVTAGLHDHTRVFKGYDLGAVDFLIKPIEPKILSSKISVFLKLFTQKQQLADRIEKLEAAELALRAERDRASWLGSLPEHSPGPVLRLATDGTILYLNPSARQAFQSWRLAVGMPAPGELFDLAARAASTRSLETAELCLEGEWFALTAQARGDEVNLYAQNVTDRKRFERGLLRANDWLRTVMDTVPVGVCYAEDPDCHTVTGNVTMQRQFEVEAGVNISASSPDPAAVGRRIRYFRDDREVPPSELPMQRAVAENKVIEPMALTAELPSGRRWQVQVSAAPVRDEGGRVLGAVAVTEDVTLRRRAEEALRASEERFRTTNTQLILADRRKNEFMATLSHELRNPLAPIKNCLYILDQAPPGGDQARRAKATIDRQVNQLTRLVDDLLDVTRVTRGKIHLRRQRLDLGELVRRALEDHRSEFEKAGVELALVPAPAPVWINADRERIAQTVGNLLQNAAKFTPQSGRVTAYVSTDPATGQALVRVVDTGVGMKPETLACVFQPFMQADTTLDRSKGGLGLGLALVKGLVELHGGTVEALSGGLGHGTEMVVRLPLDLTACADDNQGRQCAGCGRHRVLIIEDNVDAADSLRDVLELEGHQVAVAYNGPLGVSRALEYRPDVILCDIGLPGMDGYDVARAIRAQQALGGVRLVALTGYAMPEDLQRAREAGFDRHMPKPPSLERTTELFAALFPEQGRLEAPPGQQCAPVLDGRPG